MPMPPMPSSGLSTAVPCSRTKARMSATERLISVGGVAWGTRLMANFSLTLRRAAGGLTTRTPARTSKSSM